MNPKDWKQLKQELINRDFKVSVKGKSKKEYIAEKDFVLVNILRGGLSNCGNKLVMYVFDTENDKIVLTDENIHYQNLLSSLDYLLEDYKEFGSFA